MDKLTLKTLEELQSDKNWELIAEYDQPPQICIDFNNNYLYNVSYNNQVLVKTCIYDKPVSGFQIAGDNENNPSKYFVFARSKN